MSDRQVLLREWTDSAVLPATAADALALLTLRYSDVVNGQRTGTVYGMTRGATQVRVIIATSTVASQQDLTNLPPSGFFAATFSIASSAGETAVLSARNLGTGMTGEDRVAITFDDSTHIAVAVGPVSALDPLRLQYGAGNADRLHLSRTFVSLQPPVTLDLLGFRHDVYAVTKSGAVTVMDVKNFERAVKQPLDALNGQRTEGTLSMSSYWNRLQTLLVAALPATMRKATGKERSVAVSHRDALRVARHGPRPTASKSGAAKTKSASGEPTMMVFLPPSSIIDVHQEDEANLKEKFEEILERRLKYAQQFHRLGVLLHDRLRFRPSNLVVGEPVFQLALTPGEEVQVRQTTESKSRTAFTEINDRETEKNTSFSSTWSTDITSSLSTQDNFASSAQIGVNASASVPDVPVEVGGSASSSMNEAHTIGANHSTTSRVSKTATVAARMRSQHRVQVEITKEGSSSLAQTRTFRNFNNLRTLHHTLFKVYRREQITLERWNAQLCFKLVVNDPARTLRDAFLIALSKIDPYDEDNYNVGPAPIEMAGNVKTFTVTAPAGGFENPFHWTQEDRWMPWSPTGGSLRVLTGVPEGYKLTSLQIDMKQVDLATFGPVVPIDGPSSPAVAESELVATEGQRFVRVAGRFKYFGGQVRWATKPKIGTPGQDVLLKVNLPLRWSAPTSLFGELESAVASATFEIRSQWHPSNPVLAEYLSKVSDARADMVANFDPDRVYELHRIAEADYPGTVVDEAIGRQLTYPANFDFSSLGQIFDLEAVVVDNLPYWVSPVTRDAYRELLARLQSLPGAFETNRLLTDCLTASAAVVYLPVKAGRESQALELLPETAGVRSSVVQQLNAYCNTHFPLVTGPALAMAAIDTPAAPIATAANAVAWANAWEQSPRQFDVLAQWSDLVPTDGIHIESHFSDTTAVDEREAKRLERL